MDSLLDHPCIYYVSSVAIKLDPSDPGMYTNRGYAWRKLGKYEEAIQDYTGAWTLDPTNLRTLNNRAYSYAKINQFQRAIEDYSHVIERDPTNTHAFHNRSIVYEKLGLRAKDQVVDLDDVKTTTVDTVKNKNT